MFVHLDDAAQHAVIIVEMGVPVRVAEHDVRSAIRPVLIGAVEETAQIGTNA